MTFGTGLLIYLGIAALTVICLKVSEEFSERERDPNFIYLMSFLWPAIIPFAILGFGVYLFEEKICPGIDNGINYLCRKIALTIQKLMSRSSEKTSSASTSTTP